MATQLEINYGIKCELDTSEAPHTEPTWSDMGRMFKNLAQSLNEVLYQATYLADGGWASTEVTGAQFTVTFTGDRKNGDPVNDYIFDPEVQYGLGDARKAKMRLANITDAGGDANQPNAGTLTIHCNGKPTFERVSLQ